MTWPFAKKDVTAAPKTGRAATGSLAEQLAQKRLREAGYTIISTNWNCRLGELDIVAEAADGLIAIVEVRARGSVAWGDAQSTVTASKQRKLIKAAGLFLSHNPHYAERPLRFDIISFDQANPQQTTADGEWLQDAFQVE